MVAIARTLFLLAFALLWGGLTFYTGFVVRVSHAQLGDPMEGGLITQRVTWILQIIGALVAVLMVWNAIAVGRRDRKLGRWLGVLAVVLVLVLIGLFVVHGQLDAVIDREAYDITNRDVFTVGHRRYNQLTTVEWLTSIAYLATTIVAWRKIDSARSEFPAQSV